MEGRNLSDGKEQIDSLDGLRGVAVLVVVLSHTSNEGNYLLPGLDMSGIGKTGVYLFFVLSSFLLSYPFTRKGRGALTKDFLLNYFFRRFMRIFPLYSVYLSIGLVSSALIYYFFQMKLGVPFYLSVQDFFDHLLLQEGKGVTWSIVVEFRFYFLLPIIVAVLTIVCGNRLLPALLISVVLITAAQLFWPQDERLPNDIRVGPYLPAFLIGVLCAVLHYNWRQSNLGCSRANQILVDAAGLLALAILIMLTPSIMSAVLGHPVPQGYFNKNIILLAALWGVVLFACINGCGVLRWVFECGWLRYLGFISFSVYLLHVISISLVRRLPVDWGLDAWLVLGCTVMISHVTWTLIEKPSSRIRLKIGSMRASVVQSGRGG